MTSGGTATARSSASRASRTTLGTPPRRLLCPARSALGQLLVAALVAALAGCSGGGHRTLDTDGIKRALVSTDALGESGWTGFGISDDTTKTASAGEDALSAATGVPQACRTALGALSQADTAPRSGASMNMGEGDQADPIRVIQVTIRGYDNPPQSVTAMASVASACAGTYPLSSTTQNGSIEVAAVPVGVDGAASVSLRIAVEESGTSLVQLAAVARGNNLVMVTGAATATQTGSADLPTLVARVVKAQVESLEKAAS